MSSTTTTSGTPINHKMIGIVSSVIGFPTDLTTAKRYCSRRASSLDARGRNYARYTNAWASKGAPSSKTVHIYRTFRYRDSWRNLPRPPYLDSTCRHCRQGVATGTAKAASSPDITGPRTEGRSSLPAQHLNGNLCPRNGFTPRGDEPRVQAGLRSVRVDRT
jgi:hypothetical protein